MKAVVYVRVSDARQSDNTSLEAQEEYCRSWCATNSVQVAKVFIEAGASAKSANRPEFQRMFQWLEQDHSGISHVVVDKWDRFSRSMDDSVSYRMQLKAWNVELVAATQPVTDDPAGRLLQNILQSFGQFDNEQRAERSLRGMKRQAEAGRFVNPAPLGYKNNGKANPSLLVDEKSAPLVRGMYERIGEGRTLSDALDWARLHGLRGNRGGEIAIQTASKQMRNPAYCGRLEILGWGISRQGDWEPLVDAGLWSKVQLALSGKSGSLQVVHTAAHDEFVLRGVLVCAGCGRVMTASKSTSKSGKKIPYYHCIRGCARLRVDVADAAFVTKLESLVPDVVKTALLQECFREAWDRKNGSAQVDRERLETQRQTLLKRKNRLLALVQDELLSEADFREQYAQVNEQITETEAALAGTPDALDCDTACSYLEHLLCNLHLLWDQSDAAVKRSFGRLIYPAGVTCSKKGLGTPVTNSIFSILGSENVPKDELVALTGIEPVF